MATVRSWMHADHQRCARCTRRPAATPRLTTCTTTNAACSALDDAVGSLRSLRIIKDDSSGSLRLVGAFQEHLRAAITNQYGLFGQAALTYGGPC